MTNSLHQSWGAKVRARREELSVTQVGLAAATSTTQATISRIERGDQCPSDSMKWKLAGALHVTVEGLFPYPAVIPPHPQTAAS